MKVNTCRRSRVTHSFIYKFGVHPAAQVASRNEDEGARGSCFFMGEGKRLFTRLLKNKPNVSSNRDLVVRDTLQSVAMEMNA